MVPQRSFKTTAAILLSRQPLRPCGSTPWVQAVQTAIRWTKRQGYAVYTSVGIQSYELLIWLARQERMSQIVVLPPDTADQWQKRQQWVIDQFDLDSGLTMFVSADQKTHQQGRWEISRDDYIISRASMLLPVSIRSGGNMNRMVNEPHRLGRRIDNQFQIPYRSRRCSLAYRIHVEQLTEAIRTFSNQYLIHWTRSANGPWPTEKCGDYYAAVVDSEVYPRRAVDTLEKILTMQLIKASGRHMPLGIETVSFTALTPQQMIPLIRWRTRYVQMSFEPYGLGIKKEFALQMGIQPVCYYHPREKPRGIAPWLTQSCGIKGDWPKEMEFRCQGDFDLKPVPRSAMVCICRTEAEAAMIAKRYDIQSFGMVTSTEDMTSNGIQF